METTPKHYAEEDAAENGDFQIICMFGKPNQTYTRQETYHPCWFHDSVPLNPLYRIATPDVLSSTLKKTDPFIL